jgi:S-formylglutathione hydrolase
MGARSSYAKVSCQREAIRSELIAMQVSKVEIGEMAAGFGAAKVPYAVIVPSDGGPHPLCLFLYGGGGSHRTLVDCHPLFERWWSEGIMAPMVMATADTGPMSYYLDHRDGSARWETFIAEDFIAHLRATYNVRRERESTFITGISMGGYGSLKIALGRTDRFGAVAAIQPLLEPGLPDSDIGARNRLHHMVGGPRELLGENRDAVFQANNPANRALANADAIKKSGLAIYLEVGDEDFLNAHDGTEFLHRVLWDLDIAHEYRLIRGGDHGGPTFVPRMRDAFVWLGSVSARLDRAGAPSSTDERAVSEWIERGLSGNPPPVDPNSDAFIRILRAQLKPVRDQAAKIDPTTSRRFVKLPKTN